MSVLVILDPSIKNKISWGCCTGRPNLNLGSFPYMHNARYCLLLIVVQIYHMLKPPESMLFSPGTRLQNENVLFKLVINLLNVKLLHPTTSIDQLRTKSQALINWLAQEQTKREINWFSHGTNPWKERIDLVRSKPQDWMNWSALGTCKPSNNYLLER